MTDYLLPQKCIGTVSLDELNWFCTPYTSFSHGFTATKIYPCVRRNIIMSLDNYIFSGLSAKKSWFHCFIFGADNDTSAPSILFKLASPYLLHALAMAWEFTNATLRFLPSILHPLSKTPKHLILLAFKRLSIKLLSKNYAKTN